MMEAVRNGAWSGKSLPYDAEVEWLESTGTQFFEIGKASDSSVLSVDLQFTSLTAGQLNGIAGGFEGRDTRFAFGIDISTSQYSKWYCGIGNLNTWNGTTDLIRHVFVIDAKNKKFSVDDTVYNVDFSAFVGVNRNICILSRLTTSGFENRCHSKIFGLSFNGVDYKTVKSDGVGCLYNVSGLGGMNADGTPRNDGLFFNRGTGAFIIGPDK